ncbi:MAG: hypothetical protein SFT94_11045 [Pseudanabaenaceae cyanobacterium bins.68]|nr:hypothetical protein [Pseudanabaenaceae cyanobacterium bins.68]
MKVWYPEPVQQLLRPSRLPKLQVQPPRLVAWQNTLGELAIILLVSGVLSLIPWLALSILVVGGLVIILQVRSQIQTYGAREAAYQAQLTIYLGKLENYALVPQNLREALTEYTYQYEVLNLPIPLELEVFNQTLEQPDFGFIAQISTKINGTWIRLYWAYINPATNLHLGILVGELAQELEAQLLVQHGWVVIQLSRAELNSEQTVRMIKNTIAKLKNLGYGHFK